MQNRIQPEQQTLESVLKQISHDLERLRTGEARPSSITYKREGDSFSVLIVPQQSNEEE